jgi:HK97 family phage portal protein
MTTILAQVLAEYASLRGRRQKVLSHRPDLAHREHVTTSTGGAQAMEFADAYVEYATTYRSYVWVRKAISKIAENIAPLPIEVLDAKGKAVAGHALVMMLNGGNEALPAVELWQGWVVNMMLAGEAFLEVVDDQRGQPLHLWGRRPDFVGVQPDLAPIRTYYPSPAGYLVQPEVTGAGMTRLLELGPGQMIHDKLYNPLNPWRGLAPIAAVRAGIVIDVLSQAWAKLFLERGARPDYALVAPQGLTASERDRLESNLMFRYSGAGNWHKPIVLEEGITDIKTFSFPPRDMEWLEQRQLSRDEVGGIFGVPDEIMGYGRDTYENFTAAMKMFWTLTLRPLVRHRDAMLTHFFTVRRPLLRPGEHIETDLSAIGDLQEDISPKVDNATKLWSLGVPWNQLDEQLALGIGPAPGGDMPWGGRGLGAAEPLPSSDGKSKEAAPTETGERFPVVDWAAYP